MFAVFKSGGKQYKVQPGDLVKLDKLEGAEKGNVDFSDIVMVGGDKLAVGADTKAAKVSAEVVTEGRDKKVIVFKKKRRQNYRRKIGHRQAFTLLRVTSITGADGKKVDAPKVEKKAAAAKPAKAANDTKAEAPAKKAASSAKKPATAEKKPAAKKAATKKAEKKD